MDSQGLVSLWCFDYSVEQHDAVAWLDCGDELLFFRLAADFDRLWINNAGSFSKHCGENIPFENITE